MAFTYQSDQMMEQLIKATASVGHKLSFKEASEYPGLPEPNTYAYFWRSFDNAAETAWRKVRGEGKNVTLSAMSKKMLQKK